MVEQYQLYTLLYKWVFNRVLNDWRESQHLISRGNEFQRVGAATENARSPSVEEVLGTASKCLSEERRARIGLYGTRRFDIYDGASPFNAFHVNRRSLKWILSRTGSQCKSFKILQLVWAVLWTDTKVNLSLCKLWYLA